MRKVVQAGVVALGACGLLLAGAGTSSAQTSAPDPSLLSILAGGDLSDLSNMVAGVFCNNTLIEYHYMSPIDYAPHPCINGPVESGNSLNSGNFINHGNPNDSGNIAMTNGSTNSANTAQGPEFDSGNINQDLGRH